MKPGASFLTCTGILPAAAISLVARSTVSWVVFSPGMISTMGMR